MCVISHPLQQASVNAADFLSAQQDASYIRA